jgi:hypothetical protein
LEGDLQGRVVLLVGAGGVVLENLNGSMPTHLGRITVVSLGGDVTVRGRVRASIVMLHRPGNRFAVGTLRVQPDATLVGSLLIPDPVVANLGLDGEIEVDPEARTSFPPSSTLGRAGAGEYVVALSPEPLFTEGRAR